MVLISAKSIPFTQILQEKKRSLTGYGMQSYEPYAEDTLANLIRIVEHFYDKAYCADQVVNSAGEWITTALGVMLDYSIL